MGLLGYGLYDEKSYSIDCEVWSSECSYLEEGISDGEGLVLPVGFEAD